VQALSVERLLLVTVVVALAFDFTNGAHDAANAIATVVATKTMTVGMAITMAVVLNVAGTLTGTEVAKTISGGLLSDSLDLRGARRLRARPGAGLRRTTGPSTRRRA